jgi:hypothetical protein
MRIIDPDEESGDEQFDASQLCCPKCGCGGVEILVYPHGTAPRLTATGWSGTWYGTGGGKAKCSQCNILFSVCIEDPDEAQAGEPTANEEPQRWMRGPRR